MRGTDVDGEIERRLVIARRELLELDRFDYAIVNDQKERAVAELRDVLEAERHGDVAELRARLAPAALPPQVREALGLV